MKDCNDTNTQKESTENFINSMKSLITQDFVTRKIQEGDFVHGCNCIFIKIDENVGLKLYFSYMKMNNARFNQRLLASKNLSVPTYLDYHEDFELRFGFWNFSIIKKRIKKSEWVPLYGYLTYIAKPLEDCDPHVLRMEIELFKAKMIDAYCMDSVYGFKTGDLKPENFGRDKNGNLVLIDTENDTLKYSSFSDKIARKISNTISGFWDILF